MIRVIITDDHAIVRRGLRQIVAGEPDISVVAEAGSAAELMEQLRANPCDVLVLDIGMPGRSGLDALKDVKYQFGGLPVLVLSVYPEDQLALRVLRAGASGYMTKETAPEELVSAIRRVHAGGRYVSAGLAERWATTVAENTPRAPHETLSDREYEVLCLIGAGRTVSQIAEALVLSVKTVSTYRARILEKMQMGTNAELMQYAMRHQLLEARSSHFA